MKILFVAMSDSVHSARWIAQIADPLSELHLFPSTDCGITYNGLRNITVHHSFHSGWDGLDKSVTLKGVPLFSEFAAQAALLVLEKYFPDWKVARLVRLIQYLKPDIIHSMETQAAGYLTAAAKEKFSNDFPPWVHTLWGSDIYLFGRLARHKDRIRNVLENCDYCICEGQRDVLPARELGYRGNRLLIYQATGGFDILRCANLRSHGLTSTRRYILLKGYQSWAGRALVGLRALERCADILSEYTVMIYSANLDVTLASELFTIKTGVPTVVLSHMPHEEMLVLQGKARLSISLSISDGVPNSLLEAMVMGSFPIQSSTSCANEWIEDGRTGLLVPPEDPEIVEQAIRRVLTDDELVNLASVENWQVIKERLDNNVVKQQVIDFYAAVAGL